MRLNPVAGSSARWIPSAHGKWQPPSLALAWPGKGVRTVSQTCAKLPRAHIKIPLPSLGGFRPRPALPAAARRQPPAMALPSPFPEWVCDRPPLFFILELRYWERKPWRFSFHQESKLTSTEHLVPCKPGLSLMGSILRRTGLSWMRWHSACLLLWFWV